MNHKHNPRISIDLPFEDEDIIVHFVGDITFIKYAEITNHKNPGYEVCLIPSGKGFFGIEELSFPIKSRQLFMTKEFQTHKGWPSIEYPYRILYICFKIKTESASQFWLEVDNKLSVIYNPITQDNYKMEEIHSRLMEEILQKRGFYQNIVGMLAKQFVITTLRNFEEDQTLNGNEANYKNSSNPVQMAMNFITGHVLERLCLDTICKELKYSAPYICKIFKNQTGFTVMEYYNFVRLEKAKDDLIYSIYNISEISEKYNFSSIHHFSKAFKELYGFSPKHCRQGATTLPK